MPTPPSLKPQSGSESGPEFSPDVLHSSGSLARRQFIARLGRGGLLFSLIFALASLVVLFVNIVDQSAGYTVTTYLRNPADLANRPIETLPIDQLVKILHENIRDTSFDNLVESALEKRDAAARTQLIDNVLRTPDDSILSEIPLDQMSDLEIVQEIIGARLGPERVRALADERTATADARTLVEFIRAEFLVPVSESDLTGEISLDEADFETLLTLINERFTDAQFARYDISELANEPQEKIVEVIRIELVGQPNEDALLGKPLNEATHEELAAYLSGRFDEETYAQMPGYFVAETTSAADLQSLVRSELLQPIDPAIFSPGKPIAQLTSREIVNAARANLPTDRQDALYTAALEIEGRDALVAHIEKDVLQPTIVQSWGLLRSLLDRAGVQREAAEAYPNVPIKFRTWITPAFLTSVMSSRAEDSGIRTALLGSLWMLALTILIALPIGVGAAVYLEELAGKGRLSQIIQINIYNLAGIPSIIYGMLGLTIFVRTLGDQLGITSGAIFGINDSNGRTILSAALTMALLILPLIIVNAQEAIRAVPTALREAAYGIGLTRLQVIWHHVLPSAVPGILTGSILAMSRAIGETAPLIVIGASTFIAVDPSGPFSKFTVLPIQIYKWTSLPDPTFRNVAAAAIVVLLIVLVSLNLTAILLRNKFRS
jgi:phosphate transport system permease protein